MNRRCESRSRCAHRSSISKRRVSHTPHAHTHTHTRISSQSWLLARCCLQSQLIFCHFQEREKKVYQSISRSRKNHDVKNVLTNSSIVHLIATEMKQKKTQFVQVQSWKKGKNSGLKVTEGSNTLKKKTHRQEDECGLYFVKHMVSLRKYNISPLTHQSGDGFIIWCRRQQIGEPSVLKSNKLGVLRITWPLEGSGIKREGAGSWETLFLPLFYICKQHAPTS